VNEVTAFSNALKIYDPPQSGVGNFGAFVSISSDSFVGTPVVLIADGPNATLGYVSARPANPIPLIGISPALYSPHRFYLAQNGSSGRCTPTQADALRNNVRRHEGATLAGVSHVAIANLAYSVDRPHTLYERTVSIVSGYDALDKSYQKWAAYDSTTLKAKQVNFDGLDQSNVLAIGCTLTFVP
jgi:hypothetical protein